MRASAVTMPWPSSTLPRAHGPVVAPAGRPGQHRLASRGSFGSAAGGSRHRPPRRGAADRPDASGCARRTGTGAAPAPRRISASARVRRALQQRGRADDHAGHAVAALGRLLVERTPAAPGAGRRRRPRPSTVAIALPSSRRQRRVAGGHDLVRRRCTAQAPHCSSPQPNWPPIRPSSLRSTYSSGVPGSTSTSWPFAVDLENDHAGTVRNPPLRHRKPPIARARAGVRLCEGGWGERSTSLPPISDRHRGITADLDP